MYRVHVFSNNVTKSKEIKEKIIKILRSNNYIITDKEPDFVIVVGGDGTMLSSIRQFNKLDVPFVGINTGNLGFLPSFLPDDINRLPEILSSKKFECNEFPLLEVHCNTLDGEKVKKLAFNEVSIRHLYPNLMEALLYINNKPFNYFTGDGFIISTPVGTTGYAIWAGGAAMHQELDVFQITPVHPNDNRINRPLKHSIVVPSSTRLDIRIIKAYKRNVQIACDGKSITDGNISHITIRISQKRIKILKNQTSSYFDLFRNKIIDKNISRYLEEDNENL